MDIMRKFTVYRGIMKFPVATSLTKFSSNVNISLAFRICAAWEKNLNSGRRKERKNHFSYSYLFHVINPQIYFLVFIIIVKNIFSFFVSSLL